MRLYFLLLLLLTGSLFLPKTAHANIVCSVTSQGINFGTINVSAVGGATGSGSIGYKCTNYGSPATNFTLCIGYGNNPSYPGTTSQPAMTGGNPPLNFNLYTNAANGQVWSSTNPMTASVSIAAGNGNSVTGAVPFYGAIPGNQTSPPGTYTAHFYNTVLGSPSGTQCNASQGVVSGLTFTLDVQAVVTNACTISVGATDINFGNRPTTAVYLDASNTITVVCPPKTAYYVGLAAPGSSTGAGTMKGTGGNTDKVPYQLHSGSPTGPIWGNTATSANAGNGVAGTGTGSLTAYAVVPSANYRPDTYTDTVTVYVNY
jgi:spore coat protein U-like protein